jgi:hypothetical protein
MERMFQEGPPAAPMAAVQTSGTVFPKRSFIEAIANGWVGWTADISRS